ncbi:hypothetical protein ILUMI_05482 [Ignelater luminosus]|uniref:Uncharacterized protein n=1 Tax=Ignelater luminosus TaxID=2038154 RepID=A0A8K0GI30_IGNLU|nr:hypothetical protein ILUMI_05482 [Ignelater luminosus]
MAKVLRHKWSPIPPIHGERGLAYTDEQKVEAFADNLDEDNAKRSGRRQTADTAACLLGGGSGANQDHSGQESSGSGRDHQQGTQGSPEQGHCGLNRDYQRHAADAPLSTAVEVKCDSTEINNIVQKQLQEFSIDFKTEIVACSTDVASVMRKFGRESPVENLLCLNRGIHLAVTDVLHKRRLEKKNSKEQSPTEEENENEESDEDEFDNDETEPQDLVILELRPNIQNAIDEVEYVQKEFHKELKLLLDVRTRRKALIDLHLIEKWNDANIPILESIIQVLTPTKVTVEALSRGDATLLSPEIVINFLMKKIKALDTSLANEIYEVLLIRIGERRDKKITTLLTYLQVPDNIKMMDRLFNSKFTTLEASTSQEREEEIENKKSSDMTLKDELDKELENVSKSCPKKDTNFKRTLRKDFGIFEVTGKRTSNLELLYRGLLSIKRFPENLSQKFETVVFGVMASQTSKYIVALCINTPNVCLDNRESNPEPSLLPDVEQFLSDSDIINHLEVVEVTEVEQNIIISVTENILLNIDVPNFEILVSVNDNSNNVLSNLELERIEAPRKTYADLTNVTFNSEYRTKNNWDTSKVTDKQYIESKAENDQSKKNKSKVLLLADSQGRGLVNQLQVNLNKNFAVNGIFKPNPTFENVTAEVKRLSSNLIREDFVIILAGTNNALDGKTVTTDNLSKTNTGSSELSREIQQTLTDFTSQFKTKLKASSRNIEAFKNRNQSWIEFPCKNEPLESRKPTGRPSHFSQSSERSKRKKSKDLRSQFSPEKLRYAGQMKLRESGNLDCASVIKDVGILPYFSDKALSIVGEARLTTSQYNIIRNVAKQQNSNIYPNYEAITTAKKSCYPKNLITESTAEAPLQSLLDHTVIHLFQALEEVIYSLIPENNNLSNTCIERNSVAQHLDDFPGSGENRDPFANSDDSDKDPDYLLSSDGTSSTHSMTEKEQEPETQQHIEPKKARKQKQNTSGWKKNAAKIARNSEKTFQHQSLEKS